MKKYFVVRDSTNKDRMIRKYPLSKVKSIKTVYAAGLEYTLGFAEGGEPIRMLSDYVPLYLKSQSDKIFSIIKCIYFEDGTVAAFQRGTVEFSIERE